MQRDPRTFAIGDIHGCALELEALLRKLSPRRDDTVVFLGDYVDRGPDSRRVVDIVLDLRSRCDVVALKGNHEAMFTDFLRHPESPGSGLFVLNGGTSTLAGYTHSDGAIEIPDTHLAFFENLKLFYETEKYFFVHAGIPDIPLKSINVAQHELHMLWSRHPFLTSSYNWGKIIVHGHTPVTQIEIRKNRINLDTGCVYDGKLTAMEFPSQRVFQVDKGVKHEPEHYPKEYSSSRISMRFQGRLALFAGRDGEEVRTYETLNYNQFGMLIKDVNPTEDYALMTGDTIEGRIGAEEEKAIAFSGTVMRCEARGGFVVYGVRIDRLSSDIGAPDWIERPQKSS